jgi:hypothetical protein
LLRDEIRDLLREQGVIIGEIKSQTYALPSGMIQTRISFVCKTKGEDEKQHGMGRIVAFPNGETKIVLDMDEILLPEEKLSIFQRDLDFVFGSYEIKR